jgi:protein SCO1
VIGAAAIAGLWYVAPAPDDGKTPIRSNGTAAIGGPFTLTDQTGRTVTDKTYAGKFELIYFGYTFCPDACPTDLQVMSRALDMLGDSAGRIQPIFITIDPERDTRVVMGDYVSQFHPSLIGLTGTLEQTAAAARAYRVYYKKADSPVEGGVYVMDHSSFTYLMGPDGSFLESFGPGTGPEDMALRIREIMGGVPA